MIMVALRMYFFVQTWAAALENGPKEGELYGLPVAIKDDMAIQVICLTCWSTFVLFFTFEYT